ncbi:MAG: hypothetical protein ABIE70_07495 [bacterium]
MRTCDNIRSVLMVVAVAVGLCWTPTVGVAQIPDPSGPDSVMIITDTSSVGSGSAPLEIHFVNDETLGGLEVTLSWDSPDLHVDSVSFATGRLQAVGSVGWSSTSNMVSIYGIAFSDLIPVGSGLLGTVWFGYSSGIAAQTANIDTVTLIQGQTEYSTTFSDAGSQYFVPQFDGGQLVLIESGCCIADRGNVNGSVEDGIDISDLVFLVNYMFNGGDEPPCLEEANINGEGEIDIADLVTLVNYMFNDGVPPASCF